MSIQHSIRGALVVVLSFFHLVNVAGQLYAAPPTGNIKTIYVCDASFSGICPNNSFKSLAQALLASGKEATRIVVLVDTPGATISKDNIILGIYSNRRKISSPLLFEERSDNIETEIVGLNFIPQSDYLNILDLESGSRIKSVDSCYQGGKIAINGTKATLDLVNNFFFKNKYSIKLNQSEVNSEGDSLLDIKNNIIKLTKSKGSFSGTLIDQKESQNGAPFSAITIGSSEALFDSANISNLGYINLFEIVGRGSKLNLNNGQIYNFGEDKSSSVMFYFSEGKNHELSMSNNIIKDNKAHIFSTPYSFPEKIDIDNLFLSTEKSGFVKFQKLRSSGHIQISNSYIKGDSGAVALESPMVEISGSGIYGFEDARFEGNSLKLDSSDINIGGSQIRVKTADANISNSKIVHNKRVDFFGSKRVALNNSLFNTPVMNASDSDGLEINGSIFKSELELFLAKNSKIQDSKFDMKSGSLIFDGTYAVSITAQNNNFIPIVQFDGVGMVGANYNKNFWGDKSSYRDQLTQCNAKGVNCGEPLDARISVSEPNVPKLSMKDIVPIQIQKECEALDDSTVYLINSTLGNPDWSIPVQYY